MRATRYLLFLFLLPAYGNAETGGSLTVRLTDLNNNPVANGIVLLQGQQELPEIDTTDTEVSQVGNQFTPHVTIIRQNSNVYFPNLDQTRHQVYSFSTVKRFVTRLFAGREAEPITFEKTGLVPVGCNIHDRMRAYIYVTNAPQFGVSDDDGLVHFTELPPGNYQIDILHPWQEEASPSQRRARLRGTDRNTTLTHNLGVISSDPRQPRRSSNPLNRGNPFAR